jgi:hypothetical protein
MLLTEGEGRQMWWNLSGLCEERAVLGAERGIGMLREDEDGVNVVGKCQAKVSVIVVAIRRWLRVSR